MARKSKANARSPFARLRARALSYPETREDLPWGESAIKVRGKTFLFMRDDDDDGLSLSLKLPRSREFALAYPFTKSTGYGLGASGWVSSSFKPHETPPMDVLESWLHESYCAIAPKKLADQVSSAQASSEKPGAGTGNRRRTAKAKSETHRRSRSRSRPSAKT